MNWDAKLHLKTGMDLAFMSRYARLFVNRFFVHGEQKIGRDGRTRYVNNIPGSVDLFRIRQALYGERTYASHGCDREGYSSWTLFDLDLPRELRREIEQTFDPVMRVKLEEHAWRTIYLMAESIMAEIRRLGLNPVPVFSGSKGIHIYILFEKLIAVKKAVKLGLLVKWLTQQTQESGALQGIIDYRAIESYPCPSDLEAMRTDGIPHLVKLPLVKHLETGKFSRFLDPVSPRLESPLPNAYLWELRPDSSQLVRDLLESFTAEIEEASAHSGRHTVEEAKTNNSEASLFKFHTSDGPLKLIERCAAMRLLVNKTIDKRHLTHEERLFVLFTLKAFGAEGTAAVHDILRQVSDYDFSKTQYYIDHAIKRDYKPYLCEKAQNKGICPLAEACPAVGHYRTPLGVVMGFDAENRSKMQPMLGELKTPFDTGSVEEIRDDIKGQILSYLRDEPEKALLIETDPGSGKTVTVAQTLANLPKDLKQYKRIFWAAQRHDMYEEIAPHIPNLKHIRPKIGEDDDFPVSDDSKVGLCIVEENIEKIRFMRDKGWPELETKKVCLYCHIGVKNCEYFLQWNHNGSFFAPQQHLITSRIQENKIKFGVIVIDENPASVFEKETVVTQDDINEMIELLQKKTFPRQELVVRLLEALKRTITSHKKLTQGYEIIKDWDSKIRLYRGEDTKQVNIIPPETKSDAGLHHLINDIDQTTFWNKWSDFIENASPEALPKNWLAPLFNAVKQQKMVFDVEHNSRIYVKKRNGHMVLGMLENKKIENEENPLIFLDATAELSEYKRLVDREILHFRKKIKLENPVYHLTEGEYPLETIMPDSEKSRRSRNRLLRITKAIIECGESTLVVSTMPFHNKYLVKYLKNARPSKEYFTGYYRNIRGSNEYEDCDQIVLIGVANPNMDEIHIREQARRVEEKYLSNKVTKDLRRYGDSQIGRPTRVYEDLRMNNTLKQKREDEMLQAIYRIRPLQNPHKKIWILTAIPLDLPAKEICLSYQEMVDMLGLKLQVSEKSYKSNTAYNKLIKAINKLKHNHHTKFTTKMLADAAGVNQRTVKDYSQRLCKDIAYLTINKNGFELQNDSK